MGAPLSFTGTVEASGKTATGIEVPEEVVDGLGSGRRPAVRATINGYTYRSSVASMGGRFLLSVSAEVRKNAGVAAGDVVEVALELDTEERTVTVPDDLTAALDAEPEARSFFAGLSYSNRLRLVLAIEGAKAPETRARRVAATVAKLKAGRS